MTRRLPTGVRITGVADELYEPCLVALIEALALASEAHWHAWMVDDLERWHRRRDVSHHRSAYGGMGSFNDLVLHKEGVPVVQENDQLAERRERLFEMVHSLRL